MELGLNNSLIAGDPRLIDHIVGEVKSQGIFDQFRKECIADVDTKPAYQNLRTRVESSVNSFLNKQTWKTDINKNQLRETLRKHIHDAPYLEVGVERIVDQVVNPKIYSVFMPQIEDVVYKFLGIERPKSQRNGACDLKDLLPKDLDPVSPESDRNSLKDISLESMDENGAETVNGDAQKINNNIIEEKIQDSKDAIKKEESNIENGKNTQVLCSSPIKATLNSSFKSDETNKTEEEEEESPVFEPIDIMNLNESNMSNDSHLSGISELTSHRSRSPDFTTEFSRDNFDCSNQDSQLSKVSSNSQLSIVTDFGSSNHAFTSIPDSKEDSKYSKDNFKYVREFDTNKDKFNFEVIKGKDSKVSNSSKENSRDASEHRRNKIKEESNSKLKHSKERHDSRNSRDKDKDSRRQHNSKYNKHYRSKSKDRSESESQESKDNSNKYKENKIKEVEKKDDSKEVKDLKDLYKEKIRELREKKELTEKEKLGKEKDSTKVYKDSKEKKESSSKERDEYKKNYKSTSSSLSRNSSYNNKNSRSSDSKDSKDSKDKSSSKRDERRHSNGKNDIKPSTKNKRDSKSDSKYENRSSDRSLKDKKRREEKKSKAIDDHPSLRKNSNDRRSTDRDGSNGSSSKYSSKNSYGATNSSNKLGPSTSLTKDNNKGHHSNTENTDNIHDSLQMMFEGNESMKSSCTVSSTQLKRVDPGTTEICLPLKKRPLHSDESMSDNQLKKVKIEEKKSLKKKVEKDIFKIDTDVASVPDEERVQIIEIPDEEYELPYPDGEPILSIEETKKIILDVEPIQPIQSKLSEMEQSIRQSLNEMMSDHGINEIDEMYTHIKSTPMDSNTLLETLTDDSNNVSENLLSIENMNIVKPKVEEPVIEKVQEMIKDTEFIQNDIIKKDETNNELVKSDIKISEENSENVKTDFTNSEKDIKDAEKNTKDHIVTENSANSKDIESIHTCINENNEDKQEDLETSSKIEVTEPNVQVTDKVAIDSKESEQNSNECMTTHSVVKENLENKLKNRDNEDGSIDNNTYEFNEDNKLVIDEEFDEKDNARTSEAKIEAKKVIKKSVKSNEKKCDNKILTESDQNEKDEMLLKLPENCIEETKEENTTNEKVEEINDDKILLKPLIEKVPKEEINKLQINDKLEKLEDDNNETLKQINENEICNKSSTDYIASTEVKNISEKFIEKNNLIQDNTKESINQPRSITKTEEINKLSEEANESKEIKIDKKTVELKKNSDNLANRDDGEDNDDDDDDKASELVIDCEETDEESEELELTSNEDLNPTNKDDKTPTLELKKEDGADFKNNPMPKKSIISKEKIDDSVKVNQSDRAMSPVEEDCYYLEYNKEEYLSLKRFLDKLEADPSQSLEDMIECLGGVVVPAKPMVAPAVPPLPKRKLSTSPISDLLVTHSNNNNNRLIKDVTAEEAYQDSSTIIKKRKVGRIKKASSTSSSNVVNPQVQPQQLQPQQPPAAIVNGDTFVMPLSPDSDVSATSDKNSGNALKDERGRQRSSQRYSSDDLYKPRPLFSSSSRRNRRFNQA